MPNPDGPRRAVGLRSLLGEHQLHEWVGLAVPSVVGSWIAARVLVAVSFLIGDLLAKHVDLPFGRLHLSQGLVSWDGSYYRVLSERGYSDVPNEVVRFFPLYPSLSRGLAPLFAGRHDIALVVIANLAALVAMFLLWKLVTELGFDAATASRSVVLLTLFPAGMCLVFAYAEAPFLLVLFLSAILLQRDRPGLAITPLVAVGLLRPTGVMVSLAVAILAWQALRSARARGDRWTVGRWSSWVAAIAAPVLSLAGYLWWLQATAGRGAAPLDVQKRLRGGFREPVTRVLHAIWDVATFHFRDVYNLAFLVVLIVALAIALRRRLPVAWTAYLAIGILVASSANNIDSLGRYGMLLAPALPLALASVTDRRWRYWSMTGIWCIGFVWFTVVATLGLVVP